MFTIYNLNNKAITIKSISLAIENLQFLKEVLTRDKNNLKLYTNMKEELSIVSTLLNETSINYK